MLLLVESAAEASALEGVLAKIVADPAKLAELLVGAPPIESSPEVRSTSVTRDLDSKDGIAAAEAASRGDGPDSNAIALLVLSRCARGPSRCPGSRATSGTRI